MINEEDPSIRMHTFLPSLGQRTQIILGFATLIRHRTGTTRSRIHPWCLAQIMIDKENPSVWRHLQWPTGRKTIVIGRRWCGCGVIIGGTLSWLSRRQCWWWGGLVCGWRRNGGRCSARRWSTCCCWGSDRSGADVVVVWWTAIGGVDVFVLCADYGKRGWYYFTNWIGE